MESQMTEAATCNVGDLKSKERGSGARSNAGKPQWWQFPWWIINTMGFTQWDAYNDRSDDDCYNLVLVAMANWQRGKDRDNLANAFLGGLTLLARQQGKAPPSLFTLRAVVDVLEFGAQKYPACEKELATGKDGRPTPLAAGNWAKGMPWSVCFSCAMSHYLQAANERDDRETGLSHWAHFLCNLAFLFAYETIYPEGDDRIAGYRA